MKTFCCGLLACCFVGLFGGMGLHQSLTESPYRHLRDPEALQMMTTVCVAVIAVALAAWFRDEGKDFSLAVAAFIHVPLCLFSFWTACRPSGQILPFLGTSLSTGMYYVHLYAGRLL